MFGDCLGLLLVAVVVCMTTVSECDKMSLNSLYWDVDAHITHPFCTRKLSYYATKIKR